MFHGPRTALQLISALFLTAFAEASIAEYYLGCPESNVSAVYPLKHKAHRARAHTSHHVKTVRVVKPKASHYHISVTYVWPLCPSCGCCGNAYYSDEEVNQRVVNGSYVSFKPESTRRPKVKNEQPYETYDMRTSDDDVMHYPDMNNQY